MSLLRAATDYDYPALVALTTAFDSITEPNDIRFVRLCGFMAPDVIPAQLLASASGSDDEIAIETIDRLHLAGVGRTIPAVNDDGFVGLLVHRLVQQSIRMRLRQSPIEELQQLVRSLEDAFWNVFTQREDGFTNADHVSAIHACAFLDFVDQAGSRRVDEFHNVSRDLDLMLVHAVATMPLIDQGAIGLASIRANRADQMLGSIENVGNSQRALVRLSAGFVSLLVGQYADAEASLVDATDYFFSAEDVDKNVIVGMYGIRGVSFLSAGKSDAAYETFNDAVRWIEEHGDRGDALAGVLWYRSIAGLRIGRVAEAESDIRRVIEHVDKVGDTTSMAAARLPLATILRRNLDHQSALRIFEEILRVSYNASDPLEAAGRIQLLGAAADASIDLGRLSDADRYLQEGSSLLSEHEPPHPMPLIAMHYASAKYAMATGRLEHGLSRISQAKERLIQCGLQRVPLFADCEFLRGNLCAASGDIRSASVAYEGVVNWYRDFAPEDTVSRASALLFFGKMKRDLGDLQPALNALSQGMAFVEPREPPQLAILRNLHLLRATVFAKLGVMVEAESDAQAALALAPSPPQMTPFYIACAKRVLTECEMGREDLVGAKNLADEAVVLFDETAPNSRDAIQMRLLRSTILRKSGKVDAALEDADAAVDALETSRRVDAVSRNNVHDNRATVLVSMVFGAGRHDKAKLLEEDLSVIVELATKIDLSADAIANIRYLRGATYRVLGDPQSAFDELSAVIDLFESRPPLYYQAFMLRAGVLVDLQRYGAAEIDASYAEPHLAALLGPEHPDYLSNLKFRAVALKELERFDEARSDIERVWQKVESNPHARSFFVQVVAIRAQLNERVGRKEDAAADNRRVLELADEIGPSVLQFAAHARKKLGGEQQV